MKTERRHSLETNELAAGLTQWIEKIKPYSGQLLTGLVLLAVVYAGLAVWDSYDAQHEQEAWNAFALAYDESDREQKGLLRIAENEEFAGTNMQEWAYVGWADRQVLLAQNTFFFDRKDTNDSLRGASGIYEAMASGASDPQIKNRAIYGLAKIYEMQNKVAEAREQYLLVRGELEPQASQRAKQLETKEVSEACEWLATAELPKFDRTGGLGATGIRPDFEATTPAADSSDATSKSLEELLGEFDSDSADENRYEETREEGAEETEEAEATSTTDGSSSTDESSQPATEEADTAQE